MSRRDCRKEQDVSFDSCAFKFKQRKAPCRMLDSGRVSMETTGKQKRRELARYGCLRLQEKTGGEGREQVKKT